MGNGSRSGLALRRMTQSAAAMLGFFVVGYLVSRSANLAWAGIAGVAGAAVGWTTVSWFRAWRQHDEWL